MTKDNGTFRKDYVHATLEKAGKIVSAQSTQTLFNRIQN